MTTLARSCAMSPGSTTPEDVGLPAPVKAQPDPLAEIDNVLRAWSSQRLAFAQRQAEARAAREQFEHDANELARTVIRPAFDAIVARLDVDRGGGRIDERLADGNHSYRLTLWMSLEGAVAKPRQDRNPYLQLDLDVLNRRFNVWEGDMWDKWGSSRDSTPWRLDEITTEAVTQRVIGILRRSASHDVAV